jgi:hypothetical protein
MRNVRLLFAATCLALLVFLVSVGLHEYLYTFDPYGWAFPGIESDRSRSLWLYRRDLYRMVALISLTLTIVFAAVTLLAKRRKR